MGMLTFLRKSRNIVERKLICLALLIAVLGMRISPITLKISMLTCIIRSLLMKSCKRSINIDVSMDDLKSVSMIDDDVVRQAIGKLKLGKSDCQFNFGSDAFIHGIDILSERLAFIVKSFLIHGFVPLFLLVCTLVPIVKDKLGDKSSSNNYRAIAISSILLKNFDWIILILHGNSLDISDLQFGFQTRSSTLMCTWVASDVISYYIRHKTSVYCLLLDLKKAFDKVKFSTFFKNSLIRECQNCL